MKTEAEKIEISKQAAEIVGRPHTVKFDEHGLPYAYNWLVDDHGACAEIAADRDFNTVRVGSRVFITDAITRNVLSTAPYVDFPSRIEATNWAICEAVIAQYKALNPDQTLYKKMAARYFESSKPNDIAPQQKE